MPLNLIAFAYRSKFMNMKVALVILMAVLTITAAVLGVIVSFM